MISSTEESKNNFVADEVRLRYEQYLSLMEVVCGGDPLCDLVSFTVDPRRFAFSSPGFLFGSAVRGIRGKALSDSEISFLLSVPTTNNESYYCKPHLYHNAI